MEETDRTEMGASESESGAVAPAAPEPPFVAPVREPGSVDWRDIAWAALIFVAALALRIAYVLQLREHSPFFQHEILDERYFDAWARAIVQGKSNAAPYFQPPLYPLFLAGLHALGGGSMFVSRLLQCGLGALNCVLLFLVGRRAFGRTVGVVAGLLGGAINWTLVFTDAELVEPTLVGFLSLSALWLLLGANRNGVGRWIAAGLLLGLAALARPVVLVFAAVMAVQALLCRRGPGGHGVRSAVLLLIGAAVPVGWITSRNLSAKGGFIPVSWDSGVRFFIGNNPQANGTNDLAMGPHVEWTGDDQPWRMDAQKSEQRALRASEVERHYCGEAWRFIRELPGEALRLTIRKLHYFWTRAELPGSKSLEAVGLQFAPLLRQCPVGFWLIGPFGLLGLTVAQKRSAALFPLWGFFLATMAGIVLYYVNTRYRMTAVYPLIVLAAYGAVWLYDAYQERRWNSFVPGLMVLASVGFLMNIRVPTGGIEQAAAYTEAGVAMYGQKQYEEASDQFRRAVALAPDPYAPSAVKARLGLGTIQYAMNDFEEAGRTFRQVLELKPDDMVALRGLCSVYSSQAAALAQNGQMKEAGNLLAESINVLEKLSQLMRPADRPYKDLAGLLAMAGRMKEATEQYLNGLQVNPKDADLHYRFGFMLSRRGAWKPAIEQFRQAVELSPDSAGVFSTVVALLMEGGQYPEALSMLRARLSKNPADTDTALALSSLLSKCPDARMRDGKEALRLAERVCAISEKRSAHALATLAAAYAEAGRPQEATKRMEEAIAMIRQTGNSNADVIVKHYSEQLEQFRAGRAYHMPAPATQPTTRAATPVQTTTRTAVERKQ